VTDLLWQHFATMLAILKHFLNAHYI